jgi:hypothetical protein
MNMPDPIIREVWRAKDALVKRFKYDLDALVAEMQRRQKRSGRKLFNRAGKASKRAKAR